MLISTLCSTLMKIYNIKGLNPYNEIKRLLSAIYCSHRVINYCCKIYELFIIMKAKCSLNFVETFIHKSYLLLYRTSIQFLKKKLSKSLVTYTCVRYCLFCILRDNYRLYLKTVLIKVTPMFLVCVYQIISLKDLFLFQFILFQKTF